MVDPDRPAPPPTLNPKAKQYERQLHKIFAVDTSAIWLTQQDWIDAKAKLENLAKDVRGVRTELTAPSDGGKGWTGPAAEAALASLTKLSDTLDGHAVKVGDVDTSLKNVYDAISAAKDAWDTKVASISTYVDPDDHKRLPAPYAPTAENAANHSVTDHEAVAAAEDAKWEQRNQAAKQVLDDLGVQTQEATGKMPIAAKDSGESPYSSTGSGPGTNYGANTTKPSGPGGYEVDPGGDPTPTDIGDPGPDDSDPGVIFPGLDPQDPDVVVIEPLPDDSDTGIDPISSDGDTSGSTGLPGPGGSAAASHAGGGGGGGIGPGGLAAGGVGAGAAGLGGLLGARRGGMPGARGGGVVPGGGASQARATGAGSRGSAARAGGVGGAARGQVIPGGGGGQARGSSSARGSAVKGATGSGRYGVPKVGGGGGVVPAGSGQGAKGGTRSGPGAGGRGSTSRGAAGRGGAVMGAAGARGSRKGDQEQPQDVDKLTHEDEETWFDGTEESSPQVWD